MSVYVVYLHQPYETSILGGFSDVSDVKLEMKDYALKHWGDYESYNDGEFLSHPENDDAPDPDPGTYISVDEVIADA